MIDFSPYRRYGNGEGVAIVFTEHGIGDDIMAMPAIKALIDSGEKVTVFCKDYTNSIWRSLGCEVYPSLDQYNRPLIDCGMYDGVRNGVREVFMLSDRFRMIHPLNSWSTIESQLNNGVSTIYPIQLLAMILGVELTSFDWTAYLKPNKVEGDYVVFAPDSVNQFRSIQKQRSIYNKLAKKNKVVVLGADDLRDMKFPFYSGNRFKDFFTVAYTMLFNNFLQKKKQFLYEKKQMVDFQRMVDLVYNAKEVICSDNGVMNLARALGVKVNASFGFSDHTKLSEQYDNFHTSQVRVNTANVEGCKSPCNNNSNRGFINRMCQGKYHYPKCMMIPINNFTS